MDTQSLNIESPVFNSGATIPDEYTADGRDLSPPLEWNGVPDEAEELVLICEDPDAPGGTFTHWLVYGIHPSRTKFPAGASKSPTDRVEYHQGMNSYNEVGYSGPNPPRGEPHHYHFRLYALDYLLHLSPGCSRNEVETAMQGHIIAEADFIGLHRAH
jgi:Raf kinase inhibitor-like YbhB/YbcL family protein